MDGDATFRIALMDSLRLLHVSQSVEALLEFTSSDFLSGRFTLREQIHKQDADVADILFSPIGEENGIILFDEDIKEAKRAQSALSESNEFLEVFVRQAPLASVVFDREMCHLTVSHRCGKSVPFWTRTFSDAPITKSCQTTEAFQC